MKRKSLYNNDTFMKMKMRSRYLLVLVFILILAYQVSAVYIGITDGYITDTEGNTVSDAQVTARVEGCTGDGCVGSTTSEVDGYYVIGNLNLPKNGNVEVTAIKGAGKGTAVGQADSYHIAHVDVVICYAPSVPSLNDVSNTHDTTITFKWESGTDPKGKSTYDDLRLDGVLQSDVSSPFIRNVDFGNHKWEVRTCNDFCCSDWSADEFTVGNSPPTAPTNAEGVSNAGIATLSWVSGIDPEGDAIYDEFQLGDEGVVTPALSPLVVVSEILLKWKVRTCDNLGACSEWVEVDTVACEEVSSECPDLDRVREIIGGYTTEMERRISMGVALYCNGVQLVNTSLYKIDIKLGKENKVSIYGQNFTLRDLRYCPWCFDGVQNYDEKGIDCGGASCPACIGGRRCPLPKLLVVLVIILALTYFVYAYGSEKWKKKGKKLEGY
jgi:hypothetical protein